MKLRRTVLVGSASLAALSFAAGSALAADNSTTVQEIVVPGIRQSLERAVQIKRTSENSVDAISATDVGKLPDKNVADALQRLPGIAIQGAAGGEGGFDEADRVSIRGTSPSLTSVTVDGHSVATGDWFILDQYSVVGRSVSFDLLPSEIVQNVVVYKTQDASILEGGVSGAVDIQTRDPLNLAKTFTFEGSAEAAFNTNAGQHGSQWQPQFNGLLGWKNADGTLGVILQGFYEKRSVVRFGQETLGWTTITAPSGTAASTAPATAAAYPQLIGDAFPTLIGSSYFEQQRTRAGFDGAVQWKSSDDKAELKLSGFYAHLGASNFNDNYMFWGNHEFGVNAPTSYTVKDGAITSATFNGSTDGLIVDNITRPGEYARTWYVNLDGRFRLGDRLTIKTQFGYTQGLGVTPQQPSFESDGVTGISYMPSGNGFQVSPTDINPLSPNGLSNDWAWNARFISRDTEYYGKADGVWDISNGIWKDVEFGLRGSSHERKVDGWDRGCSLGGTAQAPVCWAGSIPFAATNPTPYPSGFNAGALGIPGLLIPIGGNPTTIGQIINAINDGVHGPISVLVANPANYYWPGSFKVQETDVEGYIMARVGGEGWRGNFGLRIADTDENAYANVPDPLGTNPADITTSAFGDYYINHVKRNYVDFLPSVNFTFDLKKNLLLRFSAAETVSRPDYSSLGGAVSLTDAIQVGSKGNPNLDRVKAAVFDAGLEYYYGPASLFAVSVFYDDLSSYVGFQTDVETYFNQLQKKNTPYTISFPINTTGKLGGVEVQWQQPIGWGFGMQANGTYVDGHDATGAPLIGTSKWVGNLVGYYEAHNISLRLAYTYRSHFFVGLDRASPESQANFGTLDASFAYQVTPNIALTVDALNITNSLLKYYGANTTEVRAVYQNGTQVFMGIKVKF